ncbi:hypothetical protein EGW08_007491 [Elysia chlorotica]|uniref:Uncharacterized protein n=1 Tax=Elysia chlorotica TaxID=188477 RepID=A0A433TT15_ELYCH|nr:hypothetical protein EGW08_007491 [Elysia chlorotica]
MSTVFSRTWRCRPVRVEDGTDPQSAVCFHCQVCLRQVDKRGANWQKYPQRAARFNSFKSAGTRFLEMAAKCSERAFTSSTRSLLSSNVMPLRWHFRDVKNVQIQDYSYELVKVILHNHVTGVNQVAFSHTQRDLMPKRIDQVSRHTREERKHFILSIHWTARGRCMRNKLLEICVCKTRPDKSDLVPGVKLAQTPRIEMFSKSEVARHYLNAWLGFSAPHCLACGRCTWHKPRSQTERERCEPSARPHALGS